MHNAEAPVQLVRDPRCAILVFALVKNAQAQTLTVASNKNVKNTINNKKADE
jgi:hypothetical protein